MSKKNNKKNNKLNVFTEEELRDLELNDDGILEVSFGENDSENKKNVPHNKGKQKVGATAKKTSELDKRVAAILKKIDVEDDPIEDDDTDIIDSEQFNEAMKAINESMDDTIDKVASVREAERLKEKYRKDENIEFLKKVAAKHDGLMDYEFAEYEVEGLEKQIKNESDPFQKAKLRKELKKAKTKFEECKQSRAATVALLQYDSLKSEVKSLNKTTIEDDVRELYRKYGNEGIRKLLTLGIDEDDEEEAI